MLEEDKEERTYKPVIDISNVNFIIDKEDFKDNTKLKEKKEPINRNYNFLFIENEVYADKVDKKVDELDEHVLKGKNIKMIACYLKLRFLERVKKFYMQQITIYRDINILTSNISSEQQELILESMQNDLPVVEEAKKNNKIILIKTNFGKIKFSRISDFFSNIEVEDDIETLDRLGKCHEKAIDYSGKLKSLGIDNEVVTAWRYGKTDKSKRLHSWNEFSIDGKEHVLDYTQNVVMNKDGYYALNHISQAISRINCKDIEEDKKIYRQIDNGQSHIDYKTYLTCRDEIMRDLQKNIDIFNEER